MSTTQFFDLVTEVRDVQKSYSNDIDAFRDRAVKHRAQDPSAGSKRSLLNEADANLNRLYAVQVQKIQSLQAILDDADSEQTKSIYSKHVNLLKRRQAFLQLEWYRARREGEVATEIFADTLVSDAGPDTFDLSTYAESGAIHSHIPLTNANRSAALKNIENDMVELSDAFLQLDGMVRAQDSGVLKMEQVSETIVDNIQSANNELDLARGSSLRRRKLKVVLTITVLGVVIAIILGTSIVLGRK